MEIPEYKVSSDQTKNVTEKTQEYIQDLCIDTKINAKVKKAYENYDVKHKQCSKTEIDRKFEIQSPKNESEIKCERQSSITNEDLQKENSSNL